MRNKVERLGLSDRVFTINTFIGKASNENPELIDYKVLAVKKEFFAYICRSDNNDILGFLYPKTENETENYLCDICCCCKKGFNMSQTI